MNEKMELCNRINGELVSKRDELKGIELLVDECAEEIHDVNGKKLSSNDCDCGIEMFFNDKSKIT